MKSNSKKAIAVSALAAILFLTLSSGVMAAGIRSSESFMLVSNSAVEGAKKVGDAAEKANQLQQVNKTLQDPGKDEAVSTETTGKESTTGDTSAVESADKESATRKSTEQSAVEKNAVEETSEKSGTQMVEDVAKDKGTSMMKKEVTKKAIGK